MKFYLLIAFCLSFIIDVTGQKIEGVAYVNQPPSGPESYLIFESNNKVIYSIDFLQGYIGQWKISNDTIEITFTTQAGKRGVGRINSASSMDYYSYTNYISYSWEINKEAIVIIKNESIVRLQFSGSSYKEHFIRQKSLILTSLF